LLWGTFIELVRDRAAAVNWFVRGRVTCIIRFFRDRAEAMILFVRDRAAAVTGKSNGAGTTIMDWQISTGFFLYAYHTS